MSLFSFRYRLNHCRKVLQQTYKLYQAQGKPPFIKDKLIALERAIQANDRQEADKLTRELEDLSKNTFHKTWFSWGLELAGALLFALVIATVIRQMWFEPYEIPTGSMRPTFKEQDHLTVSKAQFGINIPLQTEHFYFDPKLVQRTSAIIFSGDGIALPDTDSTFLGIFPYKKRYIKRLMGKPEDQVYFYGGKLFGYDADGNLIAEFMPNKDMEKLEYIPLISFEGSVKKTSPQGYSFNYFNTPYARASMGPLGLWKGEIYNGSEWISDNVTAAKMPHDKISTLSDLFGMGNYGMAQIYTKEELLSQGLKAPSDGLLYLVIRHTPHLDFRKPQEFSRLPLVMTTVLPLDENNLKTLLNSMYTARFDVQNGKVRRYSLEPHPFHSNSPLLAGVPDGTYELYYGKAYKVGFGGTTTELPETHPLYSLKPSQIQELYNLGTNWDNSYVPKGKNHGWPNRYVYFRNGDLYTMGSPLLTKESAQLKAFNENEAKQQSTLTSYVAFSDKGPPKELPAFYKEFALKIPPKHYLVLGDNHAMSGDSRLFGFVPEENLQGVPDLIIWPFGDRFGPPNQKPYPTFVIPRLIVWSLAALIGFISYVIYRKKLRKPLVF